MKAKTQLVAGIIALVSLLAYTLVHTGSTLATYVNPAIVGYVAAFGIELSIVSLSLRIGELRKSRQNATFFYFVLVAVVVVSAIANVSEGYKVAYGGHLTLDSLSQLDIIETVIGLSATGLISLIVLALSEIVGTDVTQTIKLVEKMTKEHDKQLSVNDNLSSIDKARQVKDDKIAERRQQVLSLLRQDATEDDIADKLGVSVRTIQRDILALNGNGRVTG
jgi:uncharacterized protein YerC